MTPRAVRDGVIAVGVPHWDRRLFDELIPLPDGTTYNSYLIRGSEKTALIDAVDPMKQVELLAMLDALDVARLDYIIANHAEQDHSGGIVQLLERYPQAVVVTNAKCAEFLKEHLLIADGRFHTVVDGGTLSLGGKTLEFILAPWVHWPETMLTYLREERILFPCDLFGSHLATSNLYATERDRVRMAAKRYYAEIMMPFRKNIQTHLERLANYDITCIAPSHGPIHNDPAFIIEAYRDWTSDVVANEVVLPYVSMHGSVERMIGYFTDALIKRGIKVVPFNLPHSDVGELAMSLVDAATVVLGTPTVLAGPHPAAVYAAYLVNALRPKTRFLSLIGSYGWGGRMPETITGLLSQVKAEFLKPVVARGYPKQEDLRELERLADDIAARHAAVVGAPARTG